MKLPADESFPEDAPPPYTPDSSSHPTPQSPSQSLTCQRSSYRHESVNTAGYETNPTMNKWQQLEETGHWDIKYGDTEGCCCSSRGGCCFSDRGGCCFSDRGGCFFSDTEGCFFGKRGGCCFSSSGGTGA